MKSGRKQRLQIVAQFVQLRDWLGFKVISCFLAEVTVKSEVHAFHRRRNTLRAALARWWFRFQAGLEFLPFAWSHHFYVGNVRSA
jgi:hypothetical protein